jgi:hypothetical protein
VKPHRIEATEVCEFSEEETAPSIYRVIYAVADACNCHSNVATWCATPGEAFAWLYAQGELPADPHFDPPLTRRVRLARVAVADFPGYDPREPYSPRLLAARLNTEGVQTAEERRTLFGEKVD